MKVLNVAVCDDEKNALEIIASAVKKIFSSHDIDARTYTFPNGKSLLSSLENNSYDLVFLDINMANIDGVEVGRRIFRLPNRPDIVFVSSNTDRVFETFDVTPFGFVRKDKFLKDIVSVIERYVEQKGKEQDSVLVFELKEKGSLVTIDVGRLKYIECLRNKQIFYIEGEEEKQIYSRMSVLEEKLIPLDFVRIHKGYLVNCRYIKRFDNNTVTLTSGEMLAVGRSKIDSSMEKYLEFIHKNGISIIG